MHLKPLLFPLVAGMLLMQACSSGKTAFLKSYRLQEVTYDADNEQIVNMIDELQRHSQVYDPHTLEKEQARIARQIRKKCLPDFDKHQVHFMLDTVQANKHFAVHTVIRADKPDYR
jgi:hypothetical protein